MNQYLFIGEAKSPTAIARGWSWEDGRLSGHTLFRALEACGIDPKVQRYVNWFDGDVHTRIEAMYEAGATGRTIVALGRKVAAALAKCRIPFLELRHPAARGRLRKSEAYDAHVRECLLGRST